ncbi:PucR family transcriptional regulator [Streptomyces sp. NPDC048254]|uniref:PucR family transcriptional regulator n=1 Tax=Streptomyces sp. NPDC048254 TaxID=3365525 RepID=UPI0037194195
MLTLRELIGNSQLRIEVVAAGEGLDKEIRWTHVTELADPRLYLNAGELVITNGLWLEECSSEEYVRQLREGGAVALAFGLRHSVADVPADLTAACTDHCLPLLVVPADVPFTAITQYMADTHAEIKSARLLESIERRDALISAASGSGGLRHLLTVFSAGRHAPVALANRLGRLLEVAFPGLGPADAELLSQVARDAGQQSEVTLSDGTVVSALGVSSRGEPEFTLLYGRPFAEITSMEWGEINQLTRFVSISLSRQKAVATMRHQFAGEVIDMALAGPHRAEELAARLKSFELNPAADFGVLALSLRNSGTASHGIGEWVRQFFTDRGIAAIVPGAWQEHLVVADMGSDAEEFPRLARKLFDELRARPRIAGPAIGVARVVQGHQALRTGLLQARDACRRARRRRNGGVVVFDGIQSHELLISMLDPGTREEFTESVLSPVTAYDHENNSDLLRSLRIFFAHDGRLSAAASELHVHVNTLRHRLERLEELLGRDLSRIEDRTDLFLALRMADAL